MRPQNHKNPKEEVRRKKAEIMFAFGIFLSSFYILHSAFAAGISTNKTFMVETNNALSPNETNFFEVNLGLLDEAIVPGGGVLGSEDWVVSQLNLPGIYVDSVLGNDTNSGTEASPLQHLHAVTAALGANSTVVTNIYLKRGSKFYESFAIPTNAFVRDYSVGVKPRITGATNLANAGFSLVPGKTNTFEMPLVVPLETNPFAFNLVQSNVLMVWQSNQRMGQRWDQNASYNNNTNTAIASVDGNPNSFFYDLTNHVLYINPSTNGSPVTNGLVYEASIRTLAIYGGSGCTVSNIIAEKVYAHDNTGQEGYAIMGYYSGTYVDCVGRHVWNHAIGIASALSSVGTNNFINCYGSDVESNITYTAPATVFVADAGNATNEVYVNFSNCLAVATPSGPPQTNSAGNQTSGWYSHELTNLNVTLVNCVASNCYYGFPCQTNITVNSNNVAVDCYNGIQAVDLANTVDHFYAYSCQNGVICQTPLTNAIVNNSQFWQMGLDAIYGRTTTTNVSMTNNIFASTNNVGFGPSLSSSFATIYSYNNSFYGLNYCYNFGMMTNLAGATTANYNNYYDNTRFASDQNPSPGYYLTWTAWTSAWPGVDANSTTNNPGYATSRFAYVVIDPSGGDTNTWVTVPAWIGVQNGGGLTNLNASQLAGTVPLGALPSSVLTNNETAAVNLNNQITATVFNGPTFSVPTSATATPTFAIARTTAALGFYGSDGWSNFPNISATSPNIGGSGLTGNMFALGTVSVGTLTTTNPIGSNYLQTVFSNYAVHLAGVPTVTFTASSSQPIYTSGTMTYRGGNDFSAHYTITNGASAGSASSGLTVFSFTPQYPFSTNAVATINQCCYNNYGESIAGDNFVRQYWCSNNVSSAGFVTNFSVLQNNYGNTLAGGTVYGVVITVSGQ
jgi:hypothetical protein